MQEIDIIFSIVILIMSVVIHEVSHGYAANLLGDITAKVAGRLTLNPLKHLDPVGSFLIPLLTYSMGGFIFGWARPVPYNPYNLRAGKWGPAIVGIAGPASNFLIALIFGLLIRFSEVLNIASPAFFSIASIVVLINIVLAVFNLIPIPPLDGSKVLFALLPYHMRNIQNFLEQYWFIFAAILVLFLWRFILPIVFILFKIITGI